MQGIHVTEYIPQRPPFVFIDSVRQIQANCAKTSFKVPKGHFFCEGGIFRTGGIIENISQTAALYAGYSYREKGMDVPLGFITAIKDLEIFWFPREQELIETSVELLNDIMDFRIFKGEVFSEDKVLLAHCELRIFVQEDHDNTEK